MSSSSAYSSLIYFFSLEILTFRSLCNRLLFHWSCFWLYIVITTIIYWKRRNLDCSLKSIWSRICWVIVDFWLGLHWCHYGIVKSKKVISNELLNLKAMELCTSLASRKRHSVMTLWTISCDICLYLWSISSFHIVFLHAMHFFRLFLQGIYLDTIFTLLLHHHVHALKFKETYEDF